MSVIRCQHTSEHIMSDPKLTGSMDANGNGNAMPSRSPRTFAPRSSSIVLRRAPTDRSAVMRSIRGQARHGRQALAQLAGERLVDLEPNRGAFVASPSVQEVHEVFEMRRIIEMAVVERICSGHGTRRLKSISATIGRERSAFESHDFSSWIRLLGRVSYGARGAHGQYGAVRMSVGSGRALHADLGAV